MFFAQPLGILSALQQGKMKQCDLGLEDHSFQKEGKQISMGKPLLIIVNGLPGTGKTTLARRLTMLLTFTRRKDERGSITFPKCNTSVRQGLDVWAKPDESPMNPATCVFAAQQLYFFQMNYWVAPGNLM